MTLLTTPPEQQDAPAVPARPPRSFSGAQLAQALPGALRDRKSVV